MQVFLLVTVVIPLLCLAEAALYVVPASFFLGYGIAAFLWDLMHK